MTMAEASVRHVVIVGLGKTGLACARFLRAQGVRVAITDSRIDPPGLADVRRDLPDLPLFLGGFDRAVIQRADEIVISPGVPVAQPELDDARARGVPMVSEIELFARVVKAPVAAITGSNGKSTVTQLLWLMAQRAGLDARIGGNFGTPALDLMGTHEPDLYVLELSSFQLETTFSLNSKVAVVLNLSADHMDRYASMTEYGAAKQRIFQGDGLQVINRQDSWVVPMANPAPRVSTSFGLDAPQKGHWGLRAAQGVTWLALGDENILPARDLRILGQHNIANALAALAMGEALGLSRDAMVAVLREFTGLPHRTQWVAEMNGVHYYNDSKGTNVGASVAAIQGWPGTLVLIAGGDGKGADFAELAEALPGKARAVVLIGRDAPHIERAIAGRVPTVYAPTMAAAVKEARRLAQAGDAVLLSPACASFDMFSGYEERGRVFTHAVLEMQA
jgi:UDP-N-acetylmuramoylalanine--D-glutamate ligase